MTSPASLPAPTDFRSIRLNDDYRSKLYQHGVLSLFTPPEEAAEMAAFEALMGAIRAALAVLIPEEDLVVFRRYGLTTRAGLMTIDDVPAIDPEALPKTTKVTVCFCPRDVRTLTRDRTGCGRVRVGSERATREDMTVETLKPWAFASSNGTELNFAQLEAQLGRGARVSIMPALQHWLVCRGATNRARQAILYPLGDVINRATTLQAVAKVWPEAMRLAVQFGGVRTAAATDEETRQITAATFMPPAHTP